MATSDTDLTHTHHLQLDQHADEVRSFTYLQRAACDAIPAPRDFTGWSSVCIVKDPENANAEVFRIDSGSGEITLDNVGNVTLTFTNVKLAELSKVVDKQALHSLERVGFPGYEYELWLIDPAGLRELRQKGLVNSDTTNGPV